MNRLQFENSPYLLQHAGNPVDWYAWKPEAFDQARKQKKPILVSIGYSTCHWCHVMERESFEDHEVATFMNAHFINIKVDREERPDVDQIYMEACQILTGGGGWPLNVFLTPEGRPFFAGTYYPPVPAYNRPSWLQVLQHMHHVFSDKRKTVEEQADRLTSMLQNSGNSFLKGNAKQLEVQSETFLRPEVVYQALRQNFDFTDGGFGGAPKFPSIQSLRFLIHFYYHNHRQEALDHAEFSVKKMIDGGIYDQLAGGLARYVTDKAWLVPHFEKMLYDNAQFCVILAELYMVTGKSIYADTLAHTLEFILTDMMNPEGGFYSAYDADSESVEGKYYVWSKKEIEDLLGPEAVLFCSYYGVTEQGNWEHQNILHRAMTQEEAAAQNGLSAADVAGSLERSRKILLRARKKRIPPGLDDKILLDWNVMQCSAFVYAYKATGDKKYLEVAEKNIAFLEKVFSHADGSLLHAYRQKDNEDPSVAAFPAYLDDYAGFIQVLLDLYGARFEEKYLVRATALCQFVLNNFFDTEEKMFYFTCGNATQEPLIVRKKELFDNATPSGNAVMVENLHRLGLLLDRQDWRNLSWQMTVRMKEAVEKYPSSFSAWALAMLGWAYSYQEIAIVGQGWEKAATLIGKSFLSHVVVEASAQPKNTPLLKGKNVIGEWSVYICKNYVCSRPLHSVEELSAKLKQKNA